MRPRSGAQQDDRARTEALARTTSERLKALHQEAERLASEERTLLGDLRRLELERQIKDEEFRQAEERRRTRRRRTSHTQPGTFAARVGGAGGPSGLRARLAELYKLGQGGYLRLLLSTAEVRSIGQTARMVAAIARRDRDRIAVHQRASRN